MNISRLFLLLFLVSCSAKYDPSIQDPALNLKQEDFLGLVEPTENDELEPLEEAPAEVAPVEVEVDLEIQDTTPLKEIIKQLAKQLSCDYAIQEDAVIKQQYKVRKRALSKVLKDLSLLTKLVIQFEDNMLFVRSDVVFSKSYSLSFLNNLRETENTLSVNTDTVGYQKGQNSNGSSSKIISKAKTDFWQETTDLIHHILNQESSTPQPHSKLNMLHVNKAAGIISVRATSAQHERIKTLLEKVKKTLTTQILLEAKVVEIKLKDEFRSGINWQAAFSKKRIQAEIFGADSVRKNIYHGLTSSQDFPRFSLKAQALESVLSLMENFGTVRTLSSPRMTILNNQVAVLKVADNLTFFNVKYDRRIFPFASDSRRVAMSSMGESIIANSTIETVPVGFIMSVQPSINLENKEVVLTLRPTITRVTQLRSDPAVELMARKDKISDVKSEIPVISVREMDSVLKVKSGEVAVLGGLMQETSDSLTAGLPGFSKTPLNYLTGSQTRDRSVTELVIFIKVHILRSERSNVADKKVYEKFFRDPRPLFKKRAQPKLVKPSGV